MKYIKISIAIFLSILIQSTVVISADSIKLKYQTDEKYPPYAYKQDGDLIGFDIELADMIFSDSPYEVEFSGDVFANAYSRLVNGETDSAGIIAFKEERKKDILFSDIILKSHIAVFTRKDTPHFKVSDLKNYKVGVGKGFYTEEILREKAKVLYYYTYDSVEDALIDLEKGKIDAVFGNQETINFLIVKEAFKSNLVPRIPNLYPLDLAIGISKDRPELVSFINGRLKDLKANGSFDLLHQKYFSSFSNEYYEKERIRTLITIMIIVLVFISIVLFLKFYIERLKRDITKINKETMLQKAYFDQLFGNSPQATVILDLEDRIVNINKSFEKLFGYISDEIMGQKLSSLILPTGEENEGEAVNEFILATKIYQDEVRRKRKDGKILNVSLLGLPILHEGKNIGVYGIYTDISQKKRQEEMIKHQAYYDSLTQLANRSHLMEKAGAAITEAKDSKGIVAFLFVDLDRFKTINDSLGHNIGDKLLVEVGCRLSGIIRKNDVLARMGGDEFIIMLKNLSSYDIAFRIADRVHETLNTRFLIEDKEINITASAGISFYPNDGKDAETLLKNSDIAMYMAKEKGRNNYQVFSKTMNESFLERLSMERNLKRAIDKDELVIHYQPLYNTTDKSLIGVEALVRWNHPEKGLVFPDLFIPIAEESGLIIPMGYWVFRNACNQIKSWQGLGVEDFKLSINLSMKQFQDRDLILMIKSICDTTGFDPQKLNLEITESVIMKNDAHTMGTMKKLANMGVSFSLDDFGTGYSSMSYLKKLPISSIKIDRTFIQDMETSYHDRTIALAIIELAHNLELEVIAEGVETKEQLEMLREMRCDGIQGYYFSKPLSAEDFYKFIHKSKF